MAVWGEGRDDRQVIKAARAFMARGTVVVTSAELADTPEGEIETLAVERARSFRVRTPKLPISPNGTGDLFAALLVSARVRGSDTPEALSHAASAIFAVLERTAAAATEEMRIVESAELLVHPQRRFDAIAIDRRRRMGGAQRYLSMAAHGADGYRCAPPILRAGEKK